MKITFVYKTGIHSNLNAKDFKPKRKNAAAVHTDAELCSYASVRITNCVYIVAPTHVETVVLLSKLKTDKHINVELEMDELDLTVAERSNL